jgi:hypothetical protein
MSGGGAEISDALYLALQAPAKLLVPGTFGGPMRAEL